MKPAAITMWQIVAVCVIAIRMNKNQNSKHIQYLLQLRFIALLTQLAVIYVVYVILRIDLPILPIIYIDAAMIIISFCTFLRARFLPQPSSERELFCQLLVDVLALAGIMYFTGGSSNPFIFMFILQIVIAAWLTSKLYSWILTIVAIALYSILTHYHVPIFYHNHYHISHYFDMHLHGMWYGFIILSLLVSYFVTKMGALIRQTDYLLAKAREESLKDEHIVALGALAAGAAHELSTPLASISLIIRELEDDYTNSPEAIEKLALANIQVSRCKTSLSSLNIIAKNIKAEGGSLISADLYLNQIMVNWQAFHPKITVTTIIETQISKAPIIIADQILSQAITSILTNCLQATCNNIVGTLAWDAQNLYITITDDGVGLSAQELKSVGTAFFTTKIDGKGLGLFLTNAVINKLGGHFSLQNRQNSQGASAAITLPLKTITI